MWTVGDTVSLERRRFRWNAWTLFRSCYADRTFVTRYKSMNLLHFISDTKTNMSLATELRAFLRIRTLYVSNVEKKNLDSLFPSFPLSIPPFHGRGMEGGGREDGGWEDGRAGGGWDGRRAWKAGGEEWGRRTGVGGGHCTSSSPPFQRTVSSIDELRDNECELCVYIRSTMPNEFRKL